MFSSKRLDKSGRADLSSFLIKLESVLAQYSEAIISSLAKIPTWAANHSNLLYAAKSIPPDINNPGQIYLSYELEEPSAVCLIGKSKDKKPIYRKLKIDQQSSQRVKITSEHKDFRTGKSYTCEGSGNTFISALDHYISSSDLSRSDSNYILNIEDNIQKNGDAFLFLNVARSKEGDYWIKEILSIVKKIIRLIPEESHSEVLTAIEHRINDFENFLKSKANNQIISHYDGRLWVILESIFNHIDPLNGKINTIGDHYYHRKKMREHLIAKYCSSFMRNIDITPELNGYLEAMKMHREILEKSCEEFLSEYKKQHLYPEIEEDREKIKEYYDQYVKLDRPHQDMKI